MSIWELGLFEWFNSKVVHPIFQIIKRGTEPKQLAFSTALGFTLGVFPVCGVTVFLCGLAIALSGGRCHTPSLMLANFVATPIELRVFHINKPSKLYPNIKSTAFAPCAVIAGLVIPFLRLGEAISGGPRFPLTSDALKKVLTGHASREVLLSIVHALLGWIVAAPFILGALYTILLPLFRYLVLRYRPLPASPKTPLFSPRAEIKVKVRDV